MQDSTFQRSTGEGYSQFCIFGVLAGQSSTLNAGQFIMGGFLNLRLKKWLRALITRSCAIIPIMIVALAFDTSEDSLDVLNEWLNVLKSIQIPFALIPLLCLVSKEEVMGIFKIGPVLKMVSWLVAALVIVIKGYLLLEFFYSEVNGWLLSSVVSAFTAAYLTFIIYLTARSTTFIFLFLENYGVRKLESVFAALIARMALSFAWMFGETEPNGVELLLGLLIPKLSSKTIQQAVGVVGCIIMPHNMFLHSALVQSREIDRSKTGRVQEALNYYSIESTVAFTISFMINLFLTAVFAKAFYRYRHSQ
ncbi:hypothetical protein HYC85_021947 [Camellia sinensis]|uniref:Uncharacterized protein n=1 Tax=Camellia sinensis TaxID=4442 RepID=A0A7J7GJE3_CAMSI|nr:hypothetical protein HYC85_021947 [Camellia sinensis]